MKTEIDGIDFVKSLLSDVAPKVAINLLRSTVHGVVVTLNKEIKSEAPIEHGDLKKSFKAKRRNMKGKDRTHASSAVITDDKTNPTQKRPDGTYTWKHVNYGTRSPYFKAANPFVDRVVDRMRPKMKLIFTEQFLIKLAKQMQKEARSKK